MATKTPAPDNFGDLARRYAGGESCKALAAEVGTTRSIFRRWLIEAGCHTRGRSEAMFAMQRRMTKSERVARVAAAHATTRGRSQTLAHRRAQARTRSRLVGHGERELLDAIIAKGWPVDHQAPVDVYNVDLVIWGRVAVELTCASIARPNTAKKLPDLIEADLVPIVITQAARVPGMLDDLIAFLELFERKPPTRGQYWVIGCTSKGPRLRLHHYDLAVIPAAVELSQSAK
jgi:hypothetical protein